MIGVSYSSIVTLNSIISTQSITCDSQYCGFIGKLSSTTFTITTLSISGVFSFSINSYDAGMIGYSLSSDVNMTSLTITATMNLADGITWSGFSDNISSIAILVGYLSGTSSTFRVNNTLATVTTNNTIWLRSINGFAQANMTLYCYNFLSVNNFGCGHYDPAYSFSLSGSNISC